MENLSIIEIKNKKKEITKIIVDSEYYESLIKCNIWKTKNGYIQIKSDNKNYYIHRFIYYNLKGNIFNKDMPFIDHIDSNKLDNRIKNLREASHSQNSQNKSKSINSISKYYGVYFDKNKTKNNWFCKIKINNRLQTYYYNIEEHAAYHYDILIKNDSNNYNKINNIAKPIDFIEYQINKIDTKLPKGLTRRDNRFIVQFKGKYIGIFNTIKEAEIAYSKLELEYNNSPKTNIELNVITRNSDGVAIIKIINKKNNMEILVDEDLYQNLIKFKWNINDSGYAISRINNKIVRMHRYVLNYNGPFVVDHINSNRLDNRIENLRIVSRFQNSQNMSKIKNTSSQYIGVSKNKNTSKYEASIKINGVKKHLGHFTNEIDAAKARDDASKKYFTHGKLNFPII